MSKILFSDFDGTLFFKEGFHQEDIEAIQTFQEEGNKFALCTGRPLGGVLALMEGKIKPDYYVLCTGGLVLDKDYRVVYGQEIPFDLVKEVCQKYENETIKCLPKQEIYQFEQSYQYVILCCEDDYYNLLMNYRIHRDMLDVQVYSLIGKQKYEELYQENIELLQTIEDIERLIKHLYD